MTVFGEPKVMVEVTCPNCGYYAGYPIVNVSDSEKKVRDIVLNHTAGSWIDSVGKIHFVCPVCKDDE